MPNDPTPAPKDETTPTPTPPPTPPANTPGATPSLLNMAQLESIRRTEETIRIALLPENLPLLTVDATDPELHEDDLTLDKLTAWQEVCKTARRTGGRAVQATSDKENITEAETLAGAALLAVIRRFQARARQKYLVKNPGKLASFGIGSPKAIDDSRESLEGWAETLLEITATDKLPQIKEANRTELAQKLQAYRDSQTGQTGGQSKATDLRDQVKALVQDIVGFRQTILAAAEAVWPYDQDATNHGKRMEFGLPPTRPFTG